MNVLAPHQLSFKIVNNIVHVEKSGKTKNARKYNKYTYNE